MYFVARSAKRPILQFCRTSVPNTPFTLLQNLKRHLHIGIPLRMDMDTEERPYGPITEEQHLDDEHMMAVDDAMDRCYAREEQNWDSHLDNGPLLDW